MDTNIEAAMIANVDTAQSRTRRMGANLSPTVLPFQRRERVSPYERLAQELGYTKTKTARDNVGRPYLQVAITNRVLIEAGLTEKVGELMAVVDASMLTEVPHWSEAIHTHNASDAHEDVAQAEWIKHTSDEALDAYIKKLAGDLRVGEVLLAALVREQDERRAK